MTQSIQSLGGIARAKKLNKKKTVAIAKKGAKARWALHKKKSSV